MSIRVDGPATWRKSMASTKSAATISIFGTLPADASEPYRPYFERRGIQRDQIGATSRCHAAVLAGGDGMRGIAGRAPNGRRGRDAERRDLADRGRHRER